MDFAADAFRCNLWQMQSTMLWQSVRSSALIPDKSRHTPGQRTILSGRW